MLERDFFFWDVFCSSLDFHKAVLKGKGRVTEILLWRWQKAHCNVGAFENRYFSWGTNFHYIQRKAFMAAADALYRWYHVLPVSQPSETAYMVGLLTGVVFRWSWVKKIPVLSNNRIGNSTWWIDSISHLPPFPFFCLCFVLFKLRVAAMWLAGGVSFPPLLPALADAVVPAALLGQLWGPPSAADPILAPDLVRWDHYKWDGRAQGEAVLSCAVLEAWG